MNDLANDPKFFYNMTQQQQQNIATFSQQFILKRCWKKSKKKQALDNGATVTQKLRLEAI